MTSITRKTHYCWCCQKEICNNERYDVRALSYRMRRWRKHIKSTSSFQDGFLNFLCYTCKREIGGLLELCKTCTHSRNCPRKNLKIYPSENIRKKYTLTPDIQKSLLKELYGSDDWLENDIDKTISYVYSSLSLKLNDRDWQDTHNHDFGHHVELNGINYSANLEISHLKRTSRTDINKNSKSRFTEIKEKHQSIWH